MNATAAHNQQCTAIRQPSVASWAFWSAIVWALFLAVLFFRYRTGDVGHLRRFVVSFPHAFGSFEASAFLSTLSAVVVAILVLLAWFGFGDMIDIALNRIFGRSQQRPSLALIIATKCAWGAGATSLLSFFAGLAHLYTKIVGGFVLALGILLFANAARKFRRTGSQKKRTSALSRVAAVIAAIPVVLAAIASLAPPIAKDTLLYHIALPKAFLDAHGIVDVPGNIAQFYALGAELNGMWAMMLGRVVNLRTGEAAFGLIQFTYFPLLLLAVFGWMRRRGFGRAESLVPVALVACIPTVYSSASSGYNDCALALYITLAIAAVKDWWRSPEARSGAEIGLAIGFALTVKLLTLFLIAPLAVLLLLRLRSARNSEGASTALVLRSGVIALLLAAAIAAPWYTRNWARTGSPVFPFYMNVFHGNAVDWDEQRSLTDQVLNARYGGYPKNVFDYAAVPFRLSVMAQPDIPAHFDGVLGITFLVGVPFLLIAAVRKRLDAELAVAAAIAGTFFIFWLFTSEQLRYLLPALPALAVAISASAFQMDRRFRSLLLVSTIPGLIVAAAWFLQQNPAAVVAGAEPRNAYLERNLDHYSIYEVANSALPDGARVWLINMRRDTYYLERPYFSDFRIEHYTLMQLVNECSTPEELHERVTKMGITHILYRADTLLDPRTSPIVDERRSPTENAQKFALMRNLLLGGNILKIDRNFVLVQLN